MNGVQSLIRFFVLLVLAVSAPLIWFFDGAKEHGPYLEVHFLDVGQGDAVFIETPEGIQVLIDGGRNGAVLDALGDVMSPRDRTIDFVIGTHPDADHVGGLVDVLERYKVRQLLITENTGESTTAEAYMKAIQEEGASVSYARTGQQFVLGASTTLTVLFPETSAEAMESNASSIVLRLTYGDTSVLLTGDSPKRIEEYLVLTQGEYLQSDVLKVGHHGSRTSTSELFLEEVAPRYAVISAGADNRYGHPHVEVTDLLFNKRVETLSTAEEGTVTFISDGVTIQPKK